MNPIFESDGIDRYKKPLLLSGKKIILMPVGRVASRSLRRSVYKVYDVTLLNKEDIADLRPDHRVVAVTRHPLERLVSAYRFAIKNDYYFQHEFTTFDSFVRLVASIPDEESDLHFASQVSLLSHDGRLLPTDRFDMQDINNLAERLEIPAVTYHIKTKTSGIAFRDMYTDELQDIAKERYKEDFAQLGYGS